MGFLPEAGGSGSRLLQCLTRVEILGRRSLCGSTNGERANALKFAHISRAKFNPRRKSRSLSIAFNREQFEVGSWNLK